MVKVVKEQTKLEDIKDDDFREVQRYFDDKSVEKEMAFKIHSHMVPEIPGNLKNKFRGGRNGSDGLTCPYCTQGDIMTQNHCLACPEWTQMRDGLDVANIDDLLIFFRKLLVELGKV